MVNTGHRSTGCATCKLRRIKCDEARPQCRKCTKGKRTCTGYRSGLATINTVTEAETSGVVLNIEIDTRPHADRTHVSQTVIGIVQTCFESLTDPVQSYKTRRLMLHNYQIATKLLRSAFQADPIDRSLIAPIHAMALYEVRDSGIFSDHTSWLTDE